MTKGWMGHLRKYLSYIVLCLFICGFIIMTASLSHAMLIVGDSIAAGYYADNTGDDDLGGFIPTLKTALGWAGASHNEGIAAATSETVEDNIDTFLATHSPSVVYLHVGTNDISFGRTISQLLTSFDYILSACRTANAELIVNEILPYDGETRKIFNARIEDWCFTNDVKLSPTFLDFTAIGGDVAASGYTSDGVHPTRTGYDLLGPLIAKAGIPTRKRTWGHDNFPDFAYASWKHWLLNGTSNISGDADDGTLNVPQSQTADSNVQSFYPNGNAIIVSSNVSDGSPIIYYRTSSSNFTRNNTVINWIEYTGAFTSSDLFIQIRVGNSGSTTAQVDDITVDWGIRGEDGYTISDIVTAIRETSVSASDRFTISDAGGDNWIIVSASDSFTIDDKARIKAGNINLKNVILKNVILKGN